MPRTIVALLLVLLAAMAQPGPSLRAQGTGQTVRKDQGGTPAAGGIAAAGAYATGRYRNLFVEAGHAQAEVTAKINAAFQQLFHGDPNTQTVYYETGRNENGLLAYLSDINN